MMGVLVDTETRGWIQADTKAIKKGAQNNNIK